MQDPTDNLSPAGRHLLKIEPQAYQRLVVTGPGSATAREALEVVRAEDLVVPKVVREHEARAMLSGLWLYHDWLDESHTISQSLDSPTGSFWHAIMHRREGDFSNSKYWYARCRAHPSMDAISAAANPIVHPYPADKLLLKLTMSGWNPSAFVDLVEQVHDQPGDPRHKLAVSLQQIEWRVLFDHCTRLAAGRPG